jgi:predicted DNA-binding transcriptional regulator AlpA
MDDKTANVITRVPLSSDLPEQGFLDLRDAAKWLGISKTTLHEWINDGDVKAVKDEPYQGKMGWRWLIPTAELRRVKAERE